MASHFTIWENGRGSDCGSHVMVRTHYMRRRTLSEGVFFGRVSQGIAGLLAEVARVGVTFPLPADCNRILKIAIYFHSGGSVSRLLK